MRIGKRRFVWPEGGTLIVAATVTGTLAGLGTFFLRRGMELIAGMSRFWLVPDRVNLIFLALLAIAIFGAVFYQKVIGENLAGSTGQIRSRFASGNYDFKRNHIFSPLIGCLVTVGFGGSAGAEGPCAFSGAAIGSKIAKMFRMSPQSVRILFGCGAAAGISGIFKSPIGGLFFAVEVLKMEMTVVGIVAVTFACLAAFCAAYVLGGYVWNVQIMTDMIFIPEHFGWIALLGVACGIYSIYYCNTQDFASRFFKSIGNIWLRAAICAVGLGVMIMILPAMFGEGYNIVSDLVNGIDRTLLEFGPFYKDFDRMPLVLCIVGVMLLLKGAAVGAVNSGGGVAGEFVPTIFAGALLGFMFATIANMCGHALPVDNFVLIATAAVMAGTIKAPLMAIFIAAEVSDRYGFLLGFLLAAGISFAISKLWDISLKVSRTASRG